MFCAMCNLLQFDMAMEKCSFIDECVPIKNYAFPEPY